MSTTAWRHGVRIVQARPVTFAVYLLHYLAFYTLPLAAGLALRAVFDALSGRAPAGANAWTFVGLVAAAEAARLMVISSTVRFGTAFHLGLEARLRGAILGWLVAGPPPRRPQPPTGDVVSRLQGDIDAMNDFMEAWIDLSGELLLCIGAVAVMFAIDAWITSVVVLPLVALVAVTDRLSARLQQLRAATREAAAGVAGFIADTFASVETLRLAGAEARVVAHLDGLNEARSRAAVRDQLFGQLLDGLRGNAASFGVGVALLLAADAMRCGTFTVGDFTLFAGYIPLAVGGPRWIGFLLARRRLADVSIGRLEGLMDGAGLLALTAEPRGLPELAAAEPLQRLSVRGLSYAHPGTDRGIRDIDFELDRRAFVVITGEVGAGKTTLLRCLAGLLAADAGVICWNGFPVDEPHAFMTPPRAAFVPQAPRLFSETLAQNIRLGHAGPDADLVEAVRLAALEDDLAGLASGLDTQLGARGVTLSGGQLQRAAAARALVRRPDLLLFDDLSSGLDAATEARLWSGLAEGGQRTCIAVSHRHAALRRADQVIVLADGRLAARGRFEELLRAGPTFAKLWAEQD
jgi:ABC-type multidrug transport system fused ATPase/permease subunit